MVFGSCCAISNDLNKRELKYYNKFASSMIQDYDPDNTEHEQNLRSFYKLVFGSDPDLSAAPGQRTMVEDIWKDIGFQGKDPRTDFRGGGHLSLLCLIYFADNYANEWEQLVKCTKEEESLMWLTAISSINLTHCLMIYLYMN